MLFNSYIYIFAFLPLALLMYHSLRRVGWAHGAVLALTLLSLLFYGWWNPVYLLLLIPLTLANYAIAKAIIFYRLKRPAYSRALLVCGLAGNVGVLGYFKYANFFVDNLNALLGMHLLLAQIVLPLGISFFTFQKIAFLIDAYRGKVERLNLLDFSLFVSFFPQLIAGPIVHHSEVLPQFRNQGNLSHHTIALGMTVFTVGLAKKVLLADTAALYATPAFAAAETGTVLGFFNAWSGALAYTLQLYFDFSGYSDMAIGAALLFGIRLPINFNSPYKAANIIEFWRRWHITLSRFLRDYLYISLGGNRHGTTRRYINLLLTMLLGGLWHGANWTFVIWGGLHGAYLIMNHAWHHLCPRRLRIPALVGRLITFVAVVIAWVFFRAADTGTALTMLSSMAGLHGAGILADTSAWCVIGILLAISWLAPNTQEITCYVGPSGMHSNGDDLPPTRIQWNPTIGWAIIIGCLFAVAIASLSRISEFIYFQF